MITKNEIIKASGLHPTRVINIYIFGSRVYGTSGRDSDWDILIVAKTPNPEVELKTDKFNIHILSPDRFQSSLDSHNIRSIECIMAPEWAKIQELKQFNFELKLPSLRHSISHISNNSWVKCKKKLQQDDYYIGIKSIWHSLRIPMFGSQIARWGEIRNWDCANDLWEELKSKKWTWQELDERFRKLHNEILSGFRIFASKH